MSILLVDKRKSRGQRMGALIGEAAEQDEAFWNNDVWAEDESDGSFDEAEEEVKPDEFDSDFNDTEDEGESDESDEDEKPRSKNPSTNKYKEPAAKKRPARPSISKEESDTEVLSSSGAGGSGSDSSDAETKPKAVRKPGRPKGSGGARARAGSKQAAAAVETTRTVRTSTKMKVQDGNSARDEMYASKAKAKPRPQIKHKFSQKELLADGLQTEKENKTWLESQKLAESERAASERANRPKQDTEDCVRLLSKRGTYNTITFPDSDSMPGIFRSPPPAPPLSKVCFITGLPARYRDPVTGLPYHDLSAFKEIRRRYPRKSDGESTKKRIKMESSKV